MDYHYLYLPVSSLLEIRGLYRINLANKTPIKEVIFLFSSLLISM